MKKMKRPQVIVKMRNGYGTCKCGEQIMFDGKGHYEFPIGFGCREGANGFVIDKGRYDGWFGVCLGCGKTAFAWEKKSIKTIKLAVGV